MQVGVLVVTTASNKGPGPSTVHDDVPWLLTVGASTVDRSLMVTVATEDVYEGNDIAFGQSLADRQRLTTVRLDVVHDLLFSNDEDHANCMHLEDEIPVSYIDGGFLKAYAFSPNPKAAIDFTRGTVVGAIVAPTMAFLSSRGPSRHFPAIPKSDLLVPGVRDTVPSGDSPMYIGFMTKTDIFSVQ
ncbi:unnamed protein product [Urochloa humidicola]